MVFKMRDNTLLEYWFIIYRRKWVVLLVIASAIISAIVLSRVLAPVYEAKATFFVPRERDAVTFYSPNGGESARGALGPIANEEAQGPFFGVLKSKSIAELVQKEFPNKTVGDLMRKDISFVLSNEFMIQVFARDKDPNVAAGIANAYLKYFNQLMSEYSLPPTTQMSSTVEHEISINQKGYLAAMKALKKFQKKKSIANLDEEAKQLIVLKTDFESQLKKSQIEHQENKHKILVTERELEKELGLYSGDEFIVSSPLLVQLNEQLANIEVKLSALKVEFHDLHPEVMALNNSYKAVQKNIDKEVGRIMKSQIKSPDTLAESLRRQLVTLHIDKSKTEASSIAIKSVLNDIEGRFSKIPELRSELDFLTLEVDRYKDQIKRLQLQLAEANAQTNRNLQIAVVVENAAPPEKPAFPILWLNIVVASLAGLSGGIFYCFLVHYMESTREKRIYRLLMAIDMSER